MICMVKIFLEFLGHCPDKIPRTQIILLHLRCLLLLSFRVDKFQKMHLQSLNQFIFGFFFLFDLFLLLVLVVGLFCYLQFLYRRMIISGDINFSFRTRTVILTRSKLLAWSRINVLGLEDQARPRRMLIVMKASQAPQLWLCSIVLVVLFGLLSG